MAVTIKHVARQAGVSIRTVSRAVNNLEGVSTETREKILAVASELGYRPSQLARALVTHRSRTLGLVIPHITNPYFAEVAQGVFDTARGRGYSVLLNHCNWLTFPNIEGWYTLVDHAIEGMITDLLYGHELDITNFSRLLSPIVVLMKPVAFPGISSVMVDMLGGASQAVAYLVSKGHRRIGMLTPTVDYLNKVDRMTAYCNVMGEAGLEQRIQFIPSTVVDPDIEAGRQTARRQLETWPDLTAIFCYNDLLAIGAIQACQENGRKVPDDCAVIGFDDISFASIIQPALTTVRVDKFGLGRQSVLRLLEMLDHPQQVFEPLCMETELVVRESA